MRSSDFDEWARAHHGIITRDSSGLSRSAWYRALDSGDLIAVHPNVARLPGAAITPEQRIIAGVFAIGRSALASHRSSARLWGHNRPDDDPVDVIVLDGRRDLDLDGVVIHRPRDRARLTPQRRFNIPCTNILRTLIDLGAVDAAAVNDAVGHAIATRLVTLPALETVLLDQATNGRDGVTALRAAVDAWAIDDKPADSVLEPAMHRLVTRFDLPPVEFHPIIEAMEVDFRVVDLPVVIECDGWAYHGLRRANFERDRERDAILTAAGWTVLRFTYRAITTRPGWTARMIRRTLDRWPTAA